MTIEGSPDGAVQPTPSRTLPPWLTQRRILMFAGIATVAVGLFLNWNWLTAIGAAPLLLSLAPCLAMCALGLCMRGGANASCSTTTKGDGPPPTKDSSRP